MAIDRRNNFFVNDLADNQPPSVSETPSKFDNIKSVYTTAIRPEQKNLSFNISDFRSEIQNNYILKPSRFLMWIELPNAVKNSDPYIDDKILLLRCESTNLPGVSMATSDIIRRYGYGRVERRPYLPTFSNLTCSFIMDRTALVHKFFYNWMNYIVNFDSSQGMKPDRRVSSPDDIGPYELSYKKDFKCPSMNLNIFDDYSNRVMVVRLFEAYPHAISDIPLSWGATEQFMTINVSFYFADYIIEYDEIDTYSPELPDERRKRRSIIGDIAKRVGDRITGEIQDKIYTFGDRQLNKIFF